MKFQTIALRSALLSFLILGPALASIHAQTTGTPNSSLFTMIRQGGWAMIPLALCSITLIYLIIHCFKETRTSNFGNDALASRIADLCSARKLEEATMVARQDPTLLGRALANGLSKFNAKSETPAIDALNNRIAETFELEENAVGQWIHYLNVVAATAPMIGLLGTVSGMIGAFQTMSTGGMGRPELLAGDIGEALITTATGLCIGIPAMIAFSYFNNRLNNALVENAQRASQVTDSLGDS